MQGQDAAGKTQGVLGIVGGEQDGVALLRQETHLLQHTELVAVIQRGGGLVHDEELRLLAQGAGNEHQLLLAAGEGGEVPLRQVGHTQLLQGGQSLLLQGLGGALERGQVPGQAHEGGVQHGIAEGGTVYLRDVGDAGRQLPAGEGPHVAAVQRDGAGVALQAAQQAAEEGALAGAVGTQHGEEITGGHGEGDILQHRRGLGIGEGQVRYREGHRRSPPFTMR